MAPRSGQFVWKNGVIPIDAPFLNIFLWSHSTDNVLEIFYADLKCATFDDLSADSLKSPTLRHSTSEPNFVLNSPSNQFVSRSDNVACHLPPDQQPPNTPKLKKCLPVKVVKLYRNGIALSRGAELVVDVSSELNPCQWLTWVDGMRLESNL